MLYTWVSLQTNDLWIEEATLSDQLLWVENNENKYSILDFDSVCARDLIIIKFWVFVTKLRKTGENLSLKDGGQ